MRMLALFLSFCLLPIAAGASPKSPPPSQPVSHPASHPALTFPPGFILSTSRPVAPVPHYLVQRVKSPIHIDGLVNEAAWQKAPVLELSFPWKEQTGPRQKTVARLLYDENNLYVSYVCDDTDLTAQYTAHDDPTYKDDCVEIFLNPDETQHFYYGMEMNLRGVLYDYFYCFPQVILIHFDLRGVQLATHFDGTLNQSADRDRGWSLEVAVPWTNFTDLAKKRVPPKPGDVWRANLSRWDGVGAKRALSVWSDSDLTIPNPHNPDRFGQLIFE